MTKAGKTTLWITILLILAILSGFLYFKFWWVFSDGTKSGELNSLTYTGYFWKTYEGEIILTGYGNKNSTGSVQSKNFKFSVADKEVARQLSQMTGMKVTVHYKEYKGSLPWRGYEKAIVDSVELDKNPDSYSGSNEEPFFL